MKARLFAMVVLGVAAISLLPCLNGQQNPAPSGQGSVEAQIKAKRVVGAVTLIDAKGVSVKLEEDALVSAGDTVVTAAESSVVLVFSNGSTVSIGQDSKVAVDEFTQDPFSEDVKVAGIDGEPSKWSHIKLNMTKGELVGNVRHLNGESTFDVQTPVGAAGIRGTTFRLVYRPTGNGQAFFSLSTGRGRVIFSGTTGTPVPVDADRELDIQVKINDKTGAVESVEIVGPGAHEISDEAKHAIEQMVKEALEALNLTVFANVQRNRSGNEPQNQSPPTTPGDGQSS